MAYSGRFKAGRRNPGHVSCELGPPPRGRSQLLDGIVVGCTTQPLDQTKQISAELPYTVSFAVKKMYTRDCFVFAVIRCFEDFGVDMTRIAKIFWHGVLIVIGRLAFLSRSFFPG